jgi:chromosomal replication initiator protein
MLSVAARYSSANCCEHSKKTGFLVLPENRFAVRALRRIIRTVAAEKRSTYCPLLLHGPPGTGKTLLASAALNAITRDTSLVTARSVAAGELSRKGVDDDFSDHGLRTCDLLIIEDIQHLASGSTDAVCDLIDYRSARGMPLVITANSGPSGMSYLPRRLSSRLASGVVIQVKPLGRHSRRAILHRAAKASNTRLTSDAKKWLIEQSETLRQSLGLLQNISQLSHTYPGPLDRKAAEQILVGAGQLTSTRSDPEQILKRVAAAFSISEKELLGASRLKTVLVPRQVAMYLTRELTELSLPRIGSFFMGRDHTTVLHACRKVEEEMENDEALSAFVKQVKQELS